MDIGNIIIVVWFTYYSAYIIQFLNPKNKNKIQKDNIKLEQLRKVPVKTLEEQKKFINIKYPKRSNSKFKISKIPKFFLQLFFIVVLFYVYSYLLKLTRFSFEIWQSVLFVIIFSLIINFLLSKLNLQKKGDITVFFRR